MGQVDIDCVRLLGERMSEPNHLRLSSERPTTPEAGPHRFWNAATPFLFGVIGLVFITLIALRLNLQPGATSLLYLIVVVFVSLRAGFISSLGVSLMAVVGLNFVFIPK